MSAHALVDDQGSAQEPLKALLRSAELVKYLPKLRLMFCSGA